MKRRAHDASHLHTHPINQRNVVVKIFIHAFLFLLAMTPVAFLVSCNSTAVSAYRSDATESGDPWEGYEKAFFFDPRDSECISIVDAIFKANNIDWNAEGSVVYFAFVEEGKLGAAISLIAQQKNLYMYEPDLPLVSSRSDLDLPRRDSSKAPTAKSPAPKP